MVSRHKWHVTSGGYAARTPVDGGIVYLHREVNRTPEGMFTDHKDGNRLNCVRSNLRTVTPSQNGYNQQKQQRSTSSVFKGVSFVAGKTTDTDRWEAYIKHGGKKEALGVFVSQMDAALAYNLRAIEVFGEHAKPNILPWDFLREVKEPRRFSDRSYSSRRGVTWHKGMNKWLAYLTVKGVRVHSSFHDTEESAVSARIKAEKSRKELCKT